MSDDGSARWVTDDDKSGVELVTVTAFTPDFFMKAQIQHQVVADAHVLQLVILNLDTIPLYQNEFKKDLTRLPTLKELWSFPHVEETVVLEYDLTPQLQTGFGANEGGEMITAIKYQLEKYGSPTWEFELQSGARALLANGNSGRLDISRERRPATFDDHQQKSAGGENERTPWTITIGRTVALTNQMKDMLNAPLTLTWKQWDLEEVTMDEEWKSDKEFMLGLMSVNPVGLKLASGCTSIIEDKEIVMTAVSHSGVCLNMHGGSHDGSGDCLEFASKNLQDDKEMVLAALSTNYNAWCYVSDRLKQDKEIILITLKYMSGTENLLVLESLAKINPSLLDDKEIMLAACQVGAQQALYIYQTQKLAGRYVMDQKWILLPTEENLRWLEFCPGKNMTVKPGSEDHTGSFMKTGNKHDEYTWVDTVGNTWEKMEYDGTTLKYKLGPEGQDIILQDDGSLIMGQIEYVHAHWTLQAAPDGASLSSDFPWFLSDREFMMAAILIDGNSLLSYKSKVPAALKEDKELLMVKIIIYYQLSLLIIAILLNHTHF